MPATAPTDTALSPEMTLTETFWAAKYSRVSRASGRTRCSSTTSATGVDRARARRGRRPAGRWTPSSSTRRPWRADLLGLLGGRATPGRAARRARRSPSCRARRRTMPLHLVADLNGARRGGGPARRHPGRPRRWPACWRWAGVVGGQRRQHVARPSTGRRRPTGRPRRPACRSRSACRSCPRRPRRRGPVPRSRAAPAPGTACGPAGPRRPRTRSTSSAPGPRAPSAPARRPCAAPTPASRRRW